MNFGLSYAIEMPPVEQNGNQVMFTDPSGNEIHTDTFLSTRYAQAAAGQVYNRSSASPWLKNVNGTGRKYPYNPFYGSVSPRLAFAWTPKFENAALGKLLGNGSTVVRGGWGRQFGRLNGSPQVLNPLLSPGLILATQCKAVQLNNTCNSVGFTDSTAFRFGIDGLSPVLAAAAPPATLPQPYHPGIDGPGVSISSPLDPTLRPSDADTINFSIQRQIGHRQLLEVGYIGRTIHHEYIYKNPNQVPYNLTLGGQSFAQAYAAVEAAFGCTQSASLCAKSAVPTVSAQPFFEAALGGTGSTYCGNVTCTQAVVNKQTSKFRAQQVFALWQALDNNAAGAGGVGFVFPRSLEGTPTSNATYGSAGQLVTGSSIAVPDAYSNYNGGYVSYKISGWHGLTLQENLTYSKALGLGTFNQYTSSIALQDNYHPQLQYGKQPFDQKLIFNTFLVYQPTWYKSQSGFVGRILGGWTFSPVVVAGTGQPLVCTTNNSGQNFGGEDGSTFTDSETCIFSQNPVTYAMHTNRGIHGSVDPNGVSVATNNSGTSGPTLAAVNVFTNPVAVYDSARAPVLGYDSADSLSNAPVGLGYVNLDVSVKKDLRIFEKYSVELSGILTNAMNHLDFSNPSLSLQSTTNWGYTKTQGNSPRAIQAGARFSF